jgi:hypothetical protein
MWALVNKYNFVIDCLVDITFEEAKKYITDESYLVEMTLKNSPAYLHGYYDGEKFFDPIKNSFKGSLEDTKYKPRVIEQHKNLV